MRLLQATLTSSKCAAETCVVGNFCWLYKEQCEALLLRTSCTPTAMHIGLKKKNMSEQLLVKYPSEACSYKH